MCLDLLSILMGAWLSRSMRYMILAIFALTSCGKFEEKFGRTAGDSTSVRVAWQGNESQQALLPGIMVYAVRVQNEDSRGSRFVANELTQVDWIVPNGAYNFYALGYSGANMTGTMYCGRANNISLSGGSVLVPLTLDSTTQCGTPPFAPPGFGNGVAAPKGLNLGFCAIGGSNINNTLFSSGCDGSGRPAVGVGQAVIVKLEEYVKWDPNQPGVGLGEGLGSLCRSGPYDVGSSAGGSGLKVPIGSPFAISISSYSDSSCASFNGSYLFRAGITQAENNNSVIFRNSSNAQVFPALQAMNLDPSTTLFALYLRNTQ